MSKKIWIERWLKDRLGPGNKFEQFNRQFCYDLIKGYLTSHPLEHLIGKKIKTEKDKEGRIISIEILKEVTP